MRPEMQREEPANRDNSAVYDAAGATPATTGSELPTVIGNERDLDDISADALTALVRSNSPPVVFRKGDVLVRLRTDPADVPHIQAMTSPMIRGRLARVARWRRQGERGGQGTLKPMPPPPEVVADLMALEDWPLPRLDRVVGAPVFGADGSLDTEPGYHPGSSTFFAPSPGLTVPSVAANPSDANIANARNLLLDLLIDFPFVSPSERAHAIGLFLLPFCRDLIAGPTPLHLFEAPSPGTGKNLLVEVLLAPSLGPEVALMTEGRDEDEWRKRITSKLIAGTPALIIDNLQRKLDSPAVASVITAPVWEDRILGLSRMARIPVTTAFAATGNNPMLSGEISRRTVRCRLDAGVERPWLRKDFAQPQLRDWIASHRGELIAAALTMIAAWLARGSRLGERTLGMFEGWSGTVGGILETVGIDGFLENLDELYDTADIEYRALLALVEVWHAEFGGRAVGTAELWPLVGKIDPPVELGDGSERSRRTRFGRVLTSQRDRRLGNFRVVAAGQHRGARQWRLHDA